MKSFLPAALLFFGTACAAPLPMPSAPQLDARNYVLIDPSSGQILAGHDAENRVPPASLTKLMTAYLTFQALSGGSLKLDQNVQVSHAAWKAGGSTMFLEPNLPATVEEVIQGMVVVSGNDAAVALAEAIGGNTESFVQMMNAAAQRLGLTETHFVDVDGLPDPAHLTSARDIGILTQAIMREYPQYLHYFGEKTFTYNRITQKNWNPLVFSDPTVTGMKTGHTDEAGYCLDATASRNGRMLIAVVLGASTREASAKSAEALLDYGFRFFETHRAYRAGQAIQQIADPEAEPERIPVGPSKDVYVTTPTGAYSGVSARIEIQKDIPLPVKKGQVVGKLILTGGGKPIVEEPLVALIPAEKAGIFTRWWHIIRARL